MRAFRVAGACLGLLFRICAILLAVCEGRELLAAVRSGLRWDGLAFSGGRVVLGRRSHLMAGVTMTRIGASLRVGAGVLRPGSHSFAHHDEAKCQQDNRLGSAHKVSGHYFSFWYNC
uniref:Putative secreted protein n=1 Tax=Ixodes ricinus TaxID=34613 RepID=A0A6B0ULU9_IXORI